MINIDKCPKCGGKWKTHLDDFYFWEGKCLLCDMMLIEEIDKPTMFARSIEEYIIFWNLTSLKCEVVKHRNFANPVLLPWLSFDISLDRLQKLMIML